MSQKISVFILAYNSEVNIGPALESVQWADEIVVIDSHSTDRTGAIAEKHGARVVQIDFEGFGKLRVAGIEHTTYDWIFSLDTDERCTPEARDEILKIINSDNPADAYHTPRRNFFMGRGDAVQWVLSGLPPATIVSPRQDDFSRRGSCARGLRVGRAVGGNEMHDRADALSQSLRSAGESESLLLA